MNKTRTTSRFLMGLTLILSVALLAGCSGYGGKVEDSGPLTAERILAKSIEASGGRKAMEKHSGMKMTGTFALPAMGVSAPIEVYQKAPNLNYTLIKSDMFGTIESGSNGEVHWEKSMMSGSKIKEGEEAAVAERQATFNMALHWDKFYTGAELMGEEDLDGKMCYKIVATPKVGEPETSWYDMETFLPVKSEMTMNSEMGSISIEMHFSDFRPVDGVLVPFETRQILMGMQEMTVTMESMEWDPEFPAGIFDLPEDIKALQ
jgi:hypothetical protein